MDTNSFGLKRFFYFFLLELGFRLVLTSECTICSYTIINDGLNIFFSVNYVTLKGEKYYTMYTN